VARYVTDYKTINRINVGFPGLINRLRDGSDISDITIPVWDVGYLDFLDVINYMQSNNTNITVIVEMDYDGMFPAPFSNQIRTFQDPFRNTKIVFVRTRSSSFY
jgi:hypothetical protein